MGLAQRVPPAGGVCYAGRVLDTHAVAQSLTAVDFTPAQADAVTAALRSVVEQGDHVTSDQFKAGIAEMRAEQRGEVIEVRAEIAEVRTEIAEVRTEIASLDTRLSTQIANLDTRLSTQIAELRTEQRTQTAEVHTEIAEVRTEIASLETRLIRWMVGTVLATGALTVGILRLFG